MVDKSMTSKITVIHTLILIYNVIVRVFVYPDHVTCDIKSSLFPGNNFMRAEHEPLPKTLPSTPDGFKASDISPKSSRVFNQLTVFIGKTIT